MHFEFGVRVFSLKLVPFFFGGVQMRNLNFTRSLFLTLLICFKKIHKKKVIKELKPKSVPKSKKYVGLPVTL